MRRRRSNSCGERRMAINCLAVPVFGRPTRQPAASRGGAGAPPRTTSRRLAWRPRASSAAAAVRPNRSHPTGRKRAGARTAASRWPSTRTTRGVRRQSGENRCSGEWFGRLEWIAAVRVWGSDREDFVGGSRLEEPWAVLRLLLRWLPRVGTPPSTVLETYVPPPSAPRELLRAGQSSVGRPLRKKVRLLARIRRFRGGSLPRLRHRRSGLRKTSMRSLWFGTTANLSTDCCCLAGAQTRAPPQAAGVGVPTGRR